MLNGIWICSVNEFKFKEFHHFTFLLQARSGLQSYLPDYKEYAKFRFLDNLIIFSTPP